MMGENGGAAFILVYVLCSIFIAVPLMVAESVIGRSTRKGPLGAIRQLAPGSAWIWVGRLSMIVPIIIVSYYSVVGGWSIDYLVRSFPGHLGTHSTAEASSLFGKVSSGFWEPLISHTLFLGASAVILVKGVRSGIEKFSKYTIPLLFVLMLFLSGYSLSLPGTEAGLDYLLKPDFSKVNSKMIISALGQALFSMSLGVGCVTTYASYMRRDNNLVKTSALTSFFDTSFALIAGFSIIPAVFSAGLRPEAGPSLVFETLPYIFSNLREMSPLLSSVIPALFFVSILIAALSSEISMMEICVEHLQNRRKKSRWKSVLIVFSATWVIGALCALSFGPLGNVRIFGNSIFGFCDKLCSDYLIVLVALAFSLFVGWRMNREKVRAEIGGKWFGPIFFMIRYIVPLAIIVILVTNVIF